MSDGIDTLPPGPRFTPRLGWRAAYRPSANYAWMRRTYGEVVTVRTPFVTLVFALTADGARQVLASEPAGYDAFDKEMFTRLAGPGSLWTLEGEPHRIERRVLMPAFHRKRVLAHCAEIERVASIHFDTWHGGTEISAYQAMLDISRDIILRMVFGVTDEAEWQAGRRVLRNILPRVHPEFIYVPALQRTWYVRWARYRRAFDEFSAFVQLVLEKRRRQEHDSDDVVTLLLQAQDDAGQPRSNDSIRDELFTILMSGHETTAVALAWALYEVGRHPQVLACLREELEGSGRDADPFLVAEGPYIRAACNETLRLHTILTEMARVLRRPRTLFGYELPAGTAIAIAIQAIHQDPTLYVEPDRFIPERFSERSFGPHEFLPFGGGHRRCLGATLANYQMRLVLAAFIRRWDYEVTGEDRDVRHNIGMGPKHGVSVRLRRERGLR